MNLKIVPAMRGRCIVFLAVLFLSVYGVRATTHVVQFGGALGYVYSPSSFNAAVGDTVIWEGDFSMHPLISTSVPSGAQTWQSTSGTSFSYRIAIAGPYAYQCEIHYTLGMIGSFTATGSAVKYDALPSHSVFAMDVQLAVRQVSGLPLVVFNVPKSGQVTIRVFDLSGRQQATVFDQSVSAGSYSLPLDEAQWARGLYFVKLYGNGLERVVSFFKAN